jgi:hypothetical protein
VAWGVEATPVARLAFLRRVVAAGQQKVAPSRPLLVSGLSVDPARVLVVIERFRLFRLRRYHPSRQSHRFGTMYRWITNDAKIAEFTQEYEDRRGRASVNREGLLFATVTFSGSRGTAKTVSQRMN